MLLSDSSLGKDFVMPTWSGKQLHLLSPEATQIEIEDIAHGLAYQCCFNGQTRHFYSVAQHSMLVAQLVPAQHRLAALLHEGATAYLGEIARPLRHLVLEVQLIEKKIMAACSEKFGVADFDTPAIRRAHSVALATEYRDLLSHTKKSEDLAEYSAPVPRRIEAITPEEAKYQFVEMLGKILDETGAQKSPSASAKHQKGQAKTLRAEPSAAATRSCRVFTLPPRFNERRLT